MKTDTRKQLRFLVVLLVVITFSAVMAHLIERDFGKVDVKIVNIINADGEAVAAKLFRPMNATLETPQPAIVNMHGYQNDKNVQDPFSIELGGAALSCLHRTHLAMGIPVAG